MEQNELEQVENKPVHDDKDNKRKPIFKTLIKGIMVFTLAISGGYIGTTWAIKEHLLDDQTTVLYQAAERYINNRVVPTINEELSISQVAALTADSVVEIKTEAAVYNNFMQQYVTSGSGSGVILTADGYIITCYHVIGNVSRIIVRLNNGEEYEASLVGQDIDNDIAIIKIKATSLSPVVIGNSSLMVVGDTVVAIGNPLGELGGTVTSGILSALDRKITIDGTSMNLMQTNAAVNPGNSGGGLFNAYGELIGIVNAKTSGNSIEGIGFAIPIDTIKDTIQQIIEKGYVTGKRMLGITIVEINDQQTATQYGVSEFGVYITSVAADSLALEVGLKVNDRIVALNNIEIKSVAELQQLYRNSLVGETVTIKVMRNNKEIDISFIRE
ncbi:MAG: trypsin-like peptidase domain-containing protein [Erysipelotrichaceae bacterium]|nr:trypsin-like peptidase domain-containing protein [Erysipelotrichaceae bacterium]